MGAEPWGYFTPFDESVERALSVLRERVFRSGEFRGSEDEPATAEQAVENADADGTASILDITGVSEAPEFCAVCPLPPAELVRVFGTATPDHKTVAAGHDLYENIERGQGVYVVVYKDGRPDEYFFAGYSFD